MSGEELKLLAKRFFEEVMNGKNYSAIDELVADDYVEHEMLPGSPEGKAAVKYIVKTFHDGFPDLTATIEQTAVEGDTLWIHYRVRGTHTGELLGVAPTGKKVDVYGVDIVKTRRGMAVEHWGIADNLAMLQQIGVVPEM